MASMMLSSLSTAASELRNAGLRYDQWLMLAWSDTMLRYRRTVIGPLWITLSTAVTVGAIGTLYGGIFGNDLSEYMPHFAIGLILWTFISAIITDGCNVFILSAGLIKSVPTPLPLHVLRMMSRHAVVLAHNAAIVVVLWMIFQWPIGLHTLLALVGLVLVLATTLGAVLLLSVVCVRFRDVPQIVGAVLQLLFLLSPIVWMPQALRGRAASSIITYNPVHYMLETVRGPLLGHEPAFSTWLLASAVAAVSLFLGMVFFGRFKHRVAYWL